MSQYLARNASSDIDFTTQSIVVESQFSQALGQEFGAQAWDLDLDPIGSF